jgi:hypothetical protein
MSSTPHQSDVPKKENIIMRGAIFSLAVVLTCSFFAAAAQASENEYGEHGEYYERGERYERDGRGYYGDGSYEGSKFYGTVEAMPQGGFLGTWRISGRDVAVTPNTVIRQLYSSLGIGAYVEVKGGGNPFTAYELEVKDGSGAMGGPNPATPPPAMGLMKFYGVVEVMPLGGFLGTWRIGGRDVIVTDRTYIKQEHGPFAPGVQVEVKGGGNPFTAYELEVKGRVIR